LGLVAAVSVVRPAHQGCQVRYGFLIDHNRCIGCHACTVACKDEHSVPVGVFRTWVKYIEKGEFPNTSRHFGVMRCNHCDAAPCIEICPTSALFRRDDGIVDFDNTRCIGCKSCMQACPYDALYIDPDSHTAAKCNFCAHRIELQLEPACVVVCPTQAIIPGDLDDPTSRIAQIVATQDVVSRKPHKGTQPKLFYTGIESDFLQPAMMEGQASHVFAGHNPAANAYSLEHSRDSAAAPSRARVVYDVAHPQPWGVIPAFYLWTKSIAAGLLIVAALLIFTNRIAGVDAIVPNVLSPLMALVFLGVTVILLIADLDRPDRFYYILTKSNPHSWLVWGTWVLIAYGLLALGWLGFALLTPNVPCILVALTAIMGIVAAAYSAFLFAQGKGRDLWQSRLFLWHLITQAVVAGAASMILTTVIATISDSGLVASGREITRTVDPLLAVAILVSVTMILAEMYTSPFTVDVKYATNLITHGALSHQFWYGAILLGGIIPFVLSSIATSTDHLRVILNIVAAVSALFGLFVFDKIWILAGQAPPLS
jgi:Fe-S-cluster-containing dehydrogenase component/formate-dependent nitrite reductase membrane component NrfD